MLLSRRRNSGVVSCSWIDPRKSTGSGGAGLYVVTRIVPKSMRMRRARADHMRVRPAPLPSR
eukprot:541272-Pyramimonas_sp.AAC.1